MESHTTTSTPYFVAYVYPGWHCSGYRPAVNEWILLDAFAPYFPGHSPLAKPAAGPYDDSTPEVAARQISLAHAYGLDAFTYFLYYRPPEFVMSAPITAAFEVARIAPHFRISPTWCIRLPHYQFPIERSEALRERREGLSTDAGTHTGHTREFPAVQDETGYVEDAFIAELTPRDIQRLLGKDALAEV